VRLTKISAAAVAGLMALPLAACSSSTSTGGAASSNKPNAGVTLSYWASNQGSSLRPPRVVTGMSSEQGVFVDV